jgi:hypothetical protein
VVLSCETWVPFSPNRGAITLASELQRASPHDILPAWQDGGIGYCEAIRLTGCENLFELYQAWRSSGVPIRSVLTVQELRGVEAAVSDLIGP